MKAASNPVTSATPSGTRCHHLDSLRGLAAMAVALCHSLGIFANIPYPTYLDHLLARSPVLFFFLLSGFVLSQSLAKEGGLSKRSIAAYFLRRFFRLYPAAFASLLLAAIAVKFYVTPASWSPANELLYRNIDMAQGVHGISGYLNAFSLRKVELVHPFWTIKTEIFCSLLLPFVLLLLKQWPTLTMPLVLILPFAMNQSDAHSYDLLGFFFCFYLGSLIQKALPLLRMLSVQATQWILCLGLLLLFFSQQSGFNDVVGSIILALLLAVLVPCNWPELKHLLDSAPLLFLGRISYSFYLIHLPILIVCWGMMQHFAPSLLCNPIHFIPGLVLFLGSVALAIPTAALLERYVERPWNSQGHRLSKYWILNN